MMRRLSNRTEITADRLWRAFIGLGIAARLRATTTNYRQHSTGLPFEGTTKKTADGLNAPKA